MTDPVPLLAMTPEQQRQWEVDGFFVCADFLSADEVQRLLAAIDAVAAEHATATGGLPEAGFQVRNLLAHGDAFLDLVDHPRMLPLVVDAIGTDIQIRTSHLDIRPQYPEGLEAGGIGMGDGADAKAGQRNMGCECIFPASATLFPADIMRDCLHFQGTLTWPRRRLCR